MSHKNIRLIPQVHKFLNVCFFEIYSYSTIPNNTLTIRFGGTTKNDGVGSLAAHIIYNPTFPEWKELGKVGGVKIGPSKEPDVEIKASGMVMTNVYGQSFGLFEMPFFSAKTLQLIRFFS